MAKTDNHEYNVPKKGKDDWHIPLNENFEQYDTDIEIRDKDANKGDYKPKQGAKFFATDTGDVYVGDGSAWQSVDSTGKEPDLDSVSVSGESDLEGFVSVGNAQQYSDDEKLGVRRQVSGNDWGGMFVETTTSGKGRPYYSYAIDGNHKAWHHYNAETGNWVLDNNGPKLMVSGNGNITLGTDGQLEFPDGTTQKHAGPAAYGTVNPDGSLDSGTPNVSSEWDSNKKRYLIEFDDFRYGTSVPANIQLTDIYSPSYTTRAAAVSDFLAVYVFDGNGNETKSKFHFTVHNPP